MSTESLLKYKKEKLTDSLLESTRSKSCLIMNLIAAIGSYDRLYRDISGELCSLHDYIETLEEKLRDKK